MFGFIKKDFGLYAPADGVCKDITECSDATFSQKILGDGIMIDPSDGVIKAPCDCRISTIFPTKHAVMMKSSQGTELMIHVGIDTVKLGGQHFETCVKPEEKVKRGKPLLQFDREEIKKKGFDTSVILVVLQSEANCCKLHLNENVTTNDLIFQIG